MELYQKSIEYYSAIDDKQFKLYIKRMQNLLQREDVQVLLLSKEQAVNTLSQEENERSKGEIKEIKV